MSIETPLPLANLFQGIATEKKLVLKNFITGLFRGP
jgi:hypothetical protein